jgi:hypothetical protein
MTKQRQHDWQQIMNDCQASGLSGMAFCKQQSISYHQFTYWRSKLRQTQGNQSNPKSGFTRVSAAAPEHSETELTVTLPTGISITGLRGDNIELLGAILRQL